MGKRLRVTGGGATSELARLNGLVLLTGLISTGTVTSCAPKGGGESPQPAATLGAAQQGQDAPGLLGSTAGSASVSSSSGSAETGGDAPTSWIISTGNDLAGPGDLMTFAHGAIPLSVGGAGAKLGAQMEEAIESIDGCSSVS